MTDHPPDTSTTEHSPCTNPPQAACIIENEPQSPPHARIPWGAGIPNWSICNLARQLQLLQTSFDTESLLGFALRASMRTSQLECGHGVSFMESTNINMKGMTKTWLMVLHVNCVKFDIRVTRGYVLPLQQTNDIYIGKLPTYTKYKLKPPDQCLLRGCHHHFHLTTVANMANAAGT